MHCVNYSPLKLETYMSFYSSIAEYISKESDQNISIIIPNVLLIIFYRLAHVFKQS